MEVLGSRWPQRRPAGVAVSARGTSAPGAQHRSLVWSGSPHLGRPPRGRREPSPLTSGFLVAYLCGVLWYAGNCYWIYDTMLIYGGLPPALSALVLLLFSLVLGGYFGLFGLCVALLRCASARPRRSCGSRLSSGSPSNSLRARITCVPWDQLGYSQVDNSLVTHLAPWTGVYGISFMLVGSQRTARRPACSCAAAIAHTVI